MHLCKHETALIKEMDGAFGGIWTRDHYLTKVTPHRARLRRLKGVPVKELLLGNKMLTVKPAANSNVASQLNRGSRRSSESVWYLFGYNVFTC